MTRLAAADERAAQGTPVGEGASSRWGGADGLEVPRIAPAVRPRVALPRHRNLDPTRSNDRWVAAMAFARGGST
jgi:hypothetical protein